MRIAIVSTPFVAVPPPSYGGTELVVATLMRELMRRGHRVTLFATGDSSGAHQVRACFARACWPPEPAAELAHAAFAARELCRDPSIDLVHCHVPSLLPFAASVDLPIVHTVHELPSDGLRALLGESRCASLHAVAISERQRQLLGGACDAVVHHGLPVDRYPLGDGDGGYLAFLGRLDRVKGAHVAIAVARTLGLPIVLAGKSHGDEPYFTRELRPALDGPGVRWIGEAGPQRKVELLGGALCTLMPIEWEEPFGLVVIESMLCGTPVIAFARGAVPELVDEGVSGWLVRSQAEMIERVRALAAAPGRFDRRRCRAVAAARFGAGRMADDYLAVYARALGQSALCVAPPA